MYIYIYIYIYIHIYIYIDIYIRTEKDGGRQRGGKRESTATTRASLHTRLYTTIRLSHQKPVFSIHPSARKKTPVDFPQVAKEPYLTPSRSSAPTM